MNAPRRWGERAPPPLAPGERLLWQGAPAWRPVARRVFHVRTVAFYFAGLTLVDMAITRASEGGGWPVVRSAAPTVLTGAACLLILLALAWATARTTRYALTTKRIVMQFGVALPATLVIPLHEVAATAARVHRDGSGDIALRLKPCGAVTLPKLWPHARPWRFRNPEPMLRDLPDAGAMAPLICRALATHAQPRHTAARREPNIQLAS